MRFLHTSDWHLGAADGDMSLYDDQCSFIGAICDIIQKEKIDAVVIAGDIYDRSVASAEAVKLYDRAMTRICGDLKCPALIIAGNHDSAERLSSCSALLSSAGLHVAGALSSDVKKITFGDTDFYLLPWFTEEKARSIFPEFKEKITSLTEAYKVVLDHIKAGFEPGRKNIVVSHSYVSGAETSGSDRAAEIGNAPKVDSSAFDGFDYVALGHIHRPCNIAPHIRYSGTPMPYSFGKEEDQIKTVTVVDTDDMSQTEIALPLLHKRTTITGTLSEILAPQCDDSVKNGYVRLQITDSYVGPETMSSIKNVYRYPLVVSGKTYEGENSSITMTMDEFEKLESDPVEIFRYFCREEVGEEASEHFMDLFRKAMNEYLEENN